MAPHRATTTCWTRSWQAEETREIMNEWKQLSLHSGINKLYCCSCMTSSSVLQHSACPAFPHPISLCSCVCMLLPASMNKLYWTHTGKHTPTQTHTHTRSLQPASLYMCKIDEGAACVCVCVSVCAHICARRWGVGWGRENTIFGTPTALPLLLRCHGNKLWTREWEGERWIERPPRIHRRV